MTLPERAISVSAGCSPAEKGIVYVMGCCDLVAMRCVLCDGLHPSLADIALSGLARFLFCFVCFVCFCSMGYTHRWWIAPFQGLFGLYDGFCTMAIAEQTKVVIFYADAV
jgi:hypothetical protein